MKRRCLPLFMALILSGCATELIGDPADLEHVIYPTGIAIHPNGKYAYIVGSNFDLDFRASDGGALYVVDLETDAVLPSSKRMGSFGTNIILTPDATRGYTVTRNDDALVWFNISNDGSTISCPKAPNADDQDLLDCRIIVNDDPTYVAMQKSRRIAADTNVETPFDLLMIAQMRNARVTAMTVKGDQNDPAFSYETASFAYSASEILSIGNERFILTGRAASNLPVLTPAITETGEIKGIYARKYISVPTAYSAYQGRGMVLDPSGISMFLINQYPNSLLRFDISNLTGGSNQTDTAKSTAMMLLPTELSKIAWIGDSQTGMIYATCVGDSSLYIIDPRQMEIEQVIPVGAGPYDMASHGDSLYILNFTDGSLWQYNVSDPAAPALVKKHLIGLPKTEE